MPSTKEIRAKIRSVHNTRKITKAMEMVAASKMKKAQDRMRAARPYGNTIRNLIGHLADASTEALVTKAWASSNALASRLFPRLRS